MIFLQFVMKNAYNYPNISHVFLKSLLSKYENLKMGKFLANSMFHYEN